MAYKYVAYDSDGNSVKGSLDAADEVSARQALENAGYTPVTLKKARGSINLEAAFPSLYGIKATDVVAFSRQLSTLLDAGLTLPQGLQLLEAQVESAAFRKVVAGMRADLESGSTFSDALAKYPNAFGDIYVHMTRAGEQSGDLSLALRQAVEYIERGQATIKKVKKALTYPSVIVAVAIFVVLILVIYVLPKLMDMFDKMEAELPLPTKILKAISDFSSSNGMLLFVLVVGIVVGTIVFLRTPLGKRVMDIVMLRVPGVKVVVLMSNLALFTRTGSTLMAAGVPLPQIMDIVTDITPNRVVKKALLEVHEGLVQGHGLAKPLSMNPLFPSLLVQMMTVGEQTGTLDKSMENVADFYDSEVNARLDTLTAMLEPIIVVAIAGLVGFIAIATIMPMYTILGTME